MNERRKDKRLDLSCELVIKRLSPEGKPETQNVLIQVSDLSARGMGFTCSQALSLGYIYEAYLKIWTKEVLHVFVQIVRGEQLQEGLQYGAVFVGMPESDAQRIMVYETVMEMTD